MRTGSNFLFGAFTTVPWQSKKRVLNVDTGEASMEPDEVGTWVSDARAFLFRIEPGPPVKLPQLAKTTYSTRHRHGLGPTFGERGTHFTCFAGTNVQILTQKALLGADLSIDLEKPHRSKSLLGGTYFCPPGANDRTFLAGSYCGWPIVDVACFQVHPRPKNEDDEVNVCLSGCCSGARLATN